MSNIEDLYITLSDIAFILAQIPRCENEIRQLKDVATALERLEQLENNNHLLKAELDDLKQIDIPVLKHNLEEKCEIIADLKTEYQKLKKAIEILKDKTNMVIVADTNNHFITYDIYGSAVISKKEYELLEEFIDYAEEVNL